MLFLNNSVAAGVSMLAFPTSNTINSETKPTQPMPKPTNTHIWCCGLVYIIGGKQTTALLMTTTQPLVLKKQVLLWMQRGKHLQPQRFEVKITNESKQPFSATLRVVLRTLYSLLLPRRKLKVLILMQKYTPAQLTDRCGYVFRSKGT